MPDELRQIAGRIRELREILEITPETMAQGLGLSVNAYLDYERAVHDLPISALYEIAHILGVDFTVLLTGESPRMDTHCVVRQGKGVSVERYAGYRFNSLAYNYKGRTMEPMIVTLEPEEGDPALVVHNGQEFNYILEGTVRVVVGSRSFDLQPGDSIYFNPAIPHGQRAAGGQTARFLTVIQV